jgi:hypothetical protein
VERAERTRRSAQAQRGRLGKRLAGAWGLAPSCFCVTGVCSTWVEFRLRLAGNYAVIALLRLGEFL